MTRQDWPRVGVFGANGFIGRNLVKRLAGEGAAVSAIGRHLDRDYFDALAVPAIEANLEDELTIAATLADIDVAVQLINSSSPGLLNNYLVADVEQNVIPHIKFIQSVLENGAGRKLIFVSSGGAVYGPPQYIPLDEQHPTVPINSYGLTKLMIEKYLFMFGNLEGLNHTILRVANPFGPGQLHKKRQGLVPAVLQKLAAGEAVQVFGDGSAQRDYIYVDDLVDAMCATIRADAANRTVINIGTGVGRSILEVVRALEDASGLKAKIEFKPARQSDVAVSILDCRYAKDLLDWEARIGFSEAITATTEAFFRDQSPGN